MITSIEYFSLILGVLSAVYAAKGVVRMLKYIFCSKGAFMHIFEFS